MNEAESASRRRTRRVFAALLLLSLLVRLYALDRASYWYDEMVSLSFAKAPTWSSVFWDNCPPLYHSILKTWVELFGISETATRALSVLFSAATTVVVARIGLELRGLRGAAAAGLSHVVLILSILYAQETRMYSLFELAAATQLLFYVRARMNASAAKSDVRKLVLSTGFLALTHYLSIVPLTVELLCTLPSLWQSRKASLARLSFQRGVATAAGVGALMLAGFYLNFFKWDALKWQKAKLALEPGSRWPFRVVYSLANESWICVALVTLLFGFAAFLGSGNSRRAQRVMGELIIVSLLIMGVASAVSQRAVFLPRYFIYLAPPFACWLAIAMDDLAAALKPRRLSLLAILPLASLGIAFPGAYVPRKENWREAAQIVADSGVDLVFTCSKPAVRWPYFESRRIEIRKWDPTSDEAHEILRSETLRRGRVWLIDSLSNADFYPEIVKWADGLELKATERTVSTGNLGLIRMILLEDASP